MADAGEVSYTLDVETAGVIEGFSKAKKSNKNMQKGLADTDRVAKKATFTLTKLAASIGGVIAAQRLWASIVSASNVGRDFEASIADLSAITGATGKDLKFLSDEAKKLGSTTKFTASQVATSFKLMASAKPDLLANADALSKVTEQALLLATASGVELVDATSAVGSALNQFGEDSSEAARFVNVLAAGAKLGASEVTQTAAALKSSGVAASSAKISFEETNAAIQILSTSAIKGEQAGTALRNIFLKLDTSTDKSLNPSIVGLGAALENLEAKGLSSAEMVKMFGLENITAVTAIMNNRTQLGELTKSLTGTSVAAEQAAIKSDTLKNSQLELASAIEGLQIAIAESGNPALRSFVDLLTETAQGATFFWQSLNEGSAQAITSEMGDINDEIVKLKKNLSQGNGLFYRDADRKQDEYNLSVAKSRMIELREELNRLQGSAPTGGFVGPLLPRGFVKPSNQGVDEPVKQTKPTPPTSSPAGEKANPFADSFGDVEGSFATGISQSIVAEDETLLEELNKQRELIQEFQDLEIGDAQSHSDALIEIRKREQAEKDRINMEVLSSGGDFFEASAEMLEAFGDDSSNAFKAIFAISKGFALAQAGLNLSKAISDALAWGGLTLPEKFSAAAAIGTAAGNVVSQITGASYNGARENGGPVNAGGLYRMGEGNKPEVLQAGTGLSVVPGDNGRVFNQNQLDQINDGGGSGGLSIQIINEPGVVSTVVSQSDKAAIIKSAVNLSESNFVEQQGNKNGKMFNSMRPNFGDGNTNGRLT